MRTTHAPTLRSLIERLRVDALRVAAEKKSWQRGRAPAAMAPVGKDLTAVASTNSGSPRAISGADCSSRYIACGRHR